ncbi:hypothetical protein [Streptomyces sp. NPDC057702]|uniref:hypothetical protein n=1 Tax=unclassified Streptomyces TaxID=2593676 RepID=UPI0036B37FED
MAGDAKGIMSLDTVVPDEAGHNAPLTFNGIELGSVNHAVFILTGKEYETVAQPVTGDPKKATSAVPPAWPEGSGQIYLKGSRDRRTNTVPFDVIHS